MVQVLEHFHVNHEIYNKYISWLETTLIPEIIKEPGFIDAKLLHRKGGSMESSGKEVRILFTIQDEASMKAYLADRALAHRQKAIDEFPGQFSATREVWLEMVSFSTKN